jgi:hypothetical protein
MKLMNREIIELFNLVGARSLDQFRGLAQTEWRLARAEVFAETDEYVPCK